MWKELGTKVDAVGGGGGVVAAGAAGTCAAFRIFHLISCGFMGM